MIRTILRGPGVLSGVLVLSACVAFDDVQAPEPSSKPRESSTEVEPEASPAAPAQERAPDGDVPAMPVDAGVPDAAKASCSERDPAPWDGKHRPGASCTEGCHDGRLLAGPPLTLGGTVYTRPTGGVPVAGATLVVTDARGRELRLTSGQNGNFYTREQLEFPLRVVAPVAASAGAARTSCNSGGCHDAGRRIALGASL